jgi:hypothetical protein
MFLKTPIKKHQKNPEEPPYCFGLSAKCPINPTCWWKDGK